MTDRDAGDLSREFERGETPEDEERPRSLREPHREQPARGRPARGQPTWDEPRRNEKSGEGCA